MLGLDLQIRDRKKISTTYIVLISRISLPSRKSVSCKVTVFSRCAHFNINSLPNSCVRVRPGRTMKRQDTLSPTILAEGSVCFHVPWFHRDMVLWQTPGAPGALGAPRHLRVWSSAPRQSISDIRELLERV